MRDGLPPGWTSSNGIVGPGERVADFAARGQPVKGVCRSQGCSRRVELEAAALCKGGLAALSMRQVQKLWMCQRLDGCGLDFHNEPPAIPLRLELFVGRPNIRLRLRRLQVLPALCGGAGHPRAVTAQEGRRPHRGGRPGGAWDCG